jgi:hypothetical protein
VSRPPAPLSLGRAARGWASTDAGARCHLHSPPKNLGPDTDIVSRKINLKICVCGRAAQAQCARCFMQPYCSLNCQVRRSRPPHASHRGYTAADTAAATAPALARAPRSLLWPYRPGPVGHGGGGGQAARGARHQGVNARVGKTGPGEKPTRCGTLAGDRDVHGRVIDGLRP